MKLGHLIAAAVCLSAGGASAAPVQWEVADGGNGHWYDFVIPTAPQTIAQTEASVEASSFMGLGGYLATVTSSQEQDFLNTIWPGAGSVTGQFNDLSYFILGGSDRDQEGSFEWIGGPEEGQTVSYTNWSAGEPNNMAATGSTEQYILGWWLDSAAGVWNDGGTDDSLSRAYVVEYSEPLVSPVPLPAGGLLLLGGLGLFRAIARRGSVQRT